MIRNGPFPDRYETVDDFSNAIPISVTWELTLACNLACIHCGSRAGKKRKNELTLSECIDIIDQLKELGTREISIIGGEAFLHKDWISIIYEISKRGINCAMQTGGYRLSESQILQAKEAGLKNVGVSIDGLSDLHNKLRGKTDSFEHAIRTLELLKKHNIPASVNTQIGSASFDQLKPLQDILIQNEVKAWQLQLTVAMGNAADNDELLLQPYQLLELMPLVAELCERGSEHDLLIHGGNNLGYFGPYESLLVRGTVYDHYTGCSAGQTALSVESDGTIKGCPSLPTADYSGGNVRNISIYEIWKTKKELRYIRDRGINDLWGFCKSCYYADVCRGGCTWTSHVLFGRPGNNPFCHHRAIELEKEGIRERINKTDCATGVPFDYGKFEIILETIQGEEVGRIANTDSFKLNDISISSELTPNDNRVPDALILCQNCKRHVFSNTKFCPFCSANIKTEEIKHKKQLSHAKQLAAQVRDMLGEK